MTKDELIRASLESGLEAGRRAGQLYGAYLAGIEPDPELLGEDTESLEIQIWVRNLAQTARERGHKLRREARCREQRRWS